MFYLAGHEGGLDGDVLCFDLSCHFEDVLDIFGFPYWDMADVIIYVLSSRGDFVF